MHLPALFVEYNADIPIGIRQDRWFDAYDGVRACGVPLIVVDSGWRWSCGYEEDYRYREVYSAFVNDGLRRPAGADVTATYVRTGSDLDVTVHVTNRSGALLGPEHSATVNVLVIERTKLIHITGRVRAANDVPLVPALAHGEAGTYTVRLTDVPMGEWSRAQVVALVDYRPSSASTHYESLQAAFAAEALPASPTPIPPSPTPIPPTATSTVPPTATPTLPPGVTPSATPSPTITPTSQYTTRLYLPYAET